MYRISTMRADFPQETNQTIHYRILKKKFTVTLAFEITRNRISLWNQSVAVSTLFIHYVQIVGRAWLCDSSSGNDKIQLRMIGSTCSTTQGFKFSYKKDCTTERHGRETHGCATKVNSTKSVFQPALRLNYPDLSQQLSNASGQKAPSAALVLQSSSYS